MRGFAAIAAVMVLSCSDVASFSSSSIHPQNHRASQEAIRELQQQRQPSLLRMIQLRRTQQELAAASSGSEQQIISPFDTSAAEGDSDNSSVATTTATAINNNEILDLTYENVELVLEGMRHFLIQDGGNVVIDEIDGPIVKLQLQGNCGTCPSSTQTMKMGYVLSTRIRFLG